ncbi:hypothetical protein EVAR_99895_1 [Eumeta japonica]|uniref:Uncharacterized protein n=1 Tax=Eumeta variegata TaxID=151549 RepID=A0A4C2A8F7_EUMVA|nr:hypothetical protein EVAR_99895_1 [Eumeta japonica]
MHINFPPLGEWTKVRCCYGYGEDLDYCRGIWFFVNKKNNRKYKNKGYLFGAPPALHLPLRPSIEIMSDRKDLQSTMRWKDTSADLAATLQQRHLGRSDPFEGNK